MKKTITQTVFALALFWLCWQGIDLISRAMSGLGTVDVLVSLFLMLMAGIFSWCFGGFLADKFLNW